MRLMSSWNALGVGSGTPVSVWVIGIPLPLIVPLCFILCVGTRTLSCILTILSIKGWLGGVRVQKLLLWVEPCSCPLLVTSLSIWAMPYFVFLLGEWLLLKLTYHWKQTKPKYKKKKKVFSESLSSKLKMFINQFRKEGVGEKSMSVVRDFFSGWSIETDVT